MEDLTERQKRVLECIIKFIREQNYTPSIIEICQSLGIRSTNGVAGHIKALVKKGYIEKTSKARSIRLTEKVRDLVSPNNIKLNKLVPLLGLIPAGTPVFSEANIEKMIPLPLETETEGVYALRVVGDSMIEDGIFEGDIIFVDSKTSPQNGDIIVALVNDEVTVKRFYLHENIIELKPANQKMNSIFVLPECVKIQGVVIGLQRFYK
ncbi:MAG: transcriptional repressor LexA [Candidatus Hydrogenedentes bacterium]|nr:transcriptional repressor LexA [Candidatus Hydrogenedentota bacterium]